MDYEKYKCKVCNDKFASIRGLNIHMNVHKKDIMPIKILDDKEESLRHGSKSVKKVEMAIFTCQFCEESFKLRNIFYKHIREQHSKQVTSLNSKTTAEANKPTKAVDKCKIFVCKICGLQNEDLTAMSEHTKEHVEKPEKKFPCRECRKSFNSPIDLKIHTKEDHQKTACPKCPKVFPSRELLKIHYRKRHKSTQCPKCEETFHMRSEVKLHYHKVHKMAKVYSEAETKGEPESQNEKSTQKSGKKEERSTRRSRSAKIDHSRKKASVQGRKSSDDLIKEIMDNQKWPELRLSRVQLNEFTSEDSLQMKKSLPDSTTDLSQELHRQGDLGKESEVEMISSTCTESSSQLGQRKRKSEASSSSESKRQRIKSCDELIEDVELERASGINDDESAKMFVDHVQSDPTDRSAESVMQESRISDVLSGSTSFLRVAQNLQSIDSLSRLDPTNVFNADDNINDHVAFILDHDNDCLAAPSSSTRSSGYSSSFSINTNISESEDFHTNPETDSSLSGIASLPHETGNPSRNGPALPESSSKTSECPNLEPESDVKKLSGSQVTPITKRRGLANFRFRSLSNKLVSSINKLRMLMEKKFTVDEADIYKSFDNLTTDWQRLEEFIEKICEDDDNEDVENYMDEAQKLSDSVDRLSKEVLRLPEDLKNYKKIIEFKSQFNLEDESDEENDGIKSEVKAEKKACNVKIEENRGTSP